MLARVSIRLGVPTYPGASLRLTGKVLRKERVDGRGRVEVSVRGANGLGDHVTGSVRLLLPPEASP